MRKRLHILLWLLIAIGTVQAQMMEPVHFTAKLTPLEGNNAEIVFSANIDAGWHVYSTDIADDGPTKATFHVDKIEGMQLIGSLEPRGQVKEAFDVQFGTNVRFFEQKATFVQKVRFTQRHYAIDCYLEYGACNDQMCMPPTTVEFSEKGDAPSSVSDDTAAEVPVSPVHTESEASAPAVADVPSDSAVSEKDDFLYPTAAETPVPAPAAAGGSPVGGTSSLWWIFLSGLIGGFLAILTPCVWPIIPMTVSFFLKRNKERKKAVSEAITYGISIVVIYVLLGLAVTLLFGASALNALSTNAIFNIFFALLLIIFAASFFGAFELTLPSSWSNKIDRKVDVLQSSNHKSERTNFKSLLSIFLMAFTLALVSFSCTGPIIGFLLVAVSTQGDILAPTIGMLGFAIALAIPFTIFALFPSLLKSAPKSGGWMNTVKVVLGFIELAFALKFLSVADLAYHWHLLDREVFLALWIVIFALMGFYLLGWLKFPHDEEHRKTNVPQFFLALISLAFAVYMVPGLWGAPLKAISAFTPPMNTQDFNLYEGSVEAQYTDYDLGVAAAKAEGKPVMLDFTGFGCVNCRKMETKVWTDPRVREILNKEYVLISLYVDDKTPLPHPVEVTENGKRVKLRTIGDKWSHFQRMKTGANTQPHYLLLDPRTDSPLNGFRSYDEDINAYLRFLETGLENYRKASLP